MELEDKMEYLAKYYFPDWKNWSVDEKTAHDLYQVIKNKYDTFRYHFEEEIPCNCSIYSPWYSDGDTRIIEGDEISFDDIQEFIKWSNE